VRQVGLARDVLVEFLAAHPPALGFGLRLGGLARLLWALFPRHGGLDGQEHDAEAFHVGEPVLEPVEHLLGLLRRQQDRHHHLLVHQRVMPEPPGLAVFDKLLDLLPVLLRTDDFDEAKRHDSTPA